MDNWRPKKLIRIVKVLNTSTKPALVDTDQGLGLLKYLGNPQGTDALIAEKLAADLAQNLLIPAPCHSLITVDQYDLTEYGTQIDPGSAFISKWMNPATTFSPESAMLGQLRETGFVSRLVVFDTWIKNTDRFSPAPGSSEPNYDNLLFVPDKQKVNALVIDHTHAFVETTFEDEITLEDWWSDETVLGIFPNLATLLDQSKVLKEIEAVNDFCANGLKEVIECIPRDWHLSQAARSALNENLTKRAEHLASWLPTELFGQQEMNYRG